MRELDRHPRQSDTHAPASEASPEAGCDTAAQLPKLVVIGGGRAGLSFAAGLRKAGHLIPEPLGRLEAPPPSTAIVLVCVPDSDIAQVAADLPTHMLVGHCSGASDESVLGRERGFTIHPLMTLDGSADALEGAYAAISGSDEDALAAAHGIAEALGMTPFRLSPDDRPAYHAAASIASNFLITIQAAAQDLAMTTGMPPQALVPLVRATLSNWEQRGPDSLTGPVARGDLETVMLQRAAVKERAPGMLDLFDTLCSATESLRDGASEFHGAAR